MSDKPARESVLNAVKFLKQYISDSPVTGLLTGTGFIDLPHNLDILYQVDYSQIPEFPVSTVKSHKGCLTYGKINSRPIIIFQGRFHLYEGYSPSQVTLPVRVMQELGVKNLILTNAAGGINLNFSAGDIMIIEDHINLTGQNPLVGPNQEEWGIRFPDMAQVYDEKLILMTQSIAEKQEIAIQKGIYAGLLGPSLETPAEIRFLKTIGSDAVGLSTVMEAISGVHAQMRILGLSLITNINDPDHPVATTLEGVLETAKKSINPISSLISGVLSSPDLLR